jgi:hypothetical protein
MVGCQQKRECPFRKSQFRGPVKAKNPLGVQAFLFAVIQKFPVGRMTTGTSGLNRFMFLKLAI